MISVLLFYQQIQQILIGLKIISRFRLRMITQPFRIIPSRINACIVPARYVCCQRISNH